MRLKEDIICPTLQGLTSLLTGEHHETFSNSHAEILDTRRPMMTRRVDSVQIGNGTAWRPDCVALLMHCCLKEDKDTNLIPTNQLDHHAAHFALHQHVHRRDLVGEPV